MAPHSSRVMIVGHPGNLGDGLTAVGSREPGVVVGTVPVLPREQTNEFLSVSINYDSKKTIPLTPLPAKFNYNPDPSLLPYHRIALTSGPKPISNHASKF